jgi:integrase
MSVRWRPDRKKWEVAVMVNGRRVRELITKKKEAEARDLELRSNRGNVKGMKPPYLVVDAFASYLKTESAQKTPKSQKADIAFITLANCFFASRKLLEDITLEDLQAFQIHCKENEHWAATTIALRMKILKSILKKAAATGRILKDPSVHWKVPRGTVRRRRPMNQAESERLLAQAKGSWFEPVLLFMRLTGARGASIAALRWRDVDFEQGIVLLTSRKGGREVEKTIPFPMFDELFQLLARERNKNPTASLEDFVFRDGSFRPLTGARVSDHGYRLIKAAGMKGLQLYSLRHALAADLTAKGVSLEIARQLMGHSSVRQTQEYAQGVGIATLKDSMRLIRGVENISAEAEPLPPIAPEEE